MPKKLINKKHLLYGGSIIISRGLEYFILFYAAHHLTKSLYGELEYYKKLIEVVSSVFAFGFPTLIMSYTKSVNSKFNFYVLSVLFVIFVSVLSIPILILTNSLFLLIPFVFYALFFNGGITPMYVLVSKGSNYASYYKIVIAFIFYTTIFILLSQFNITSKVYVYVSYLLLPIFSCWFLYEIFTNKIQVLILKKYWKLLKKLLIKSFTLVVSNFANLMFLYTDIFIIKLIAQNANESIADYSFALNVSGMLMIIALTLIQVDIEKLKFNKLYLSILKNKLLKLIFLGSLFLIVFYKLLLVTYFSQYKDTYLLFLILLLAKIIHSFSTLYGTNIIVNKAFKENLVINISMLFLNILVSYLLFDKLGIYGVAIASVFSLFIRLIWLININNKILNR